MHSMANASFAGKWVIVAKIVVIVIVLKNRTMLSLRQGESRRNPDVRRYVVRTIHNYSDTTTESDELTGI